MKGSRGSSGGPLLVLAVDRDDDLGAAGVETPVVGRDAVIDVAVKYALRNPEDADVNVLFAAVKLLDELRASGRSAEIAVVAGHPMGGVEADLRIAEQVRRLRDELKPSGVVFVSDGVDDEQVIPVVASIVPVVAVHRVVVEQHRGVEEAYMLLAKYVRKAIEDPRYARIFLGVPGLALTVFSLLALAGLLQQAVLLGAFAAGLVMVMRGFGLEDRILRTLSKGPVMVFALIIAVIGYAAAVLLSYYMLVTGATPLPIRVAAAIRGAVGLAAFSTLVLIVGHALYKVASGDFNLAAELTAFIALGVATMVLLLVADSIQSLERLTPADLLVSMINHGVHVAALAGVVAVALTWWASNVLFQELTRRRTSGSASSSS